MQTRPHSPVPTWGYGGDHGEWEHDGNFCVDGLFYPDRSPSTGARVARFTYRPIRVSHLSGDKYEVFNTMSFTDGSEYLLKLEWSDGSVSEIVPDVNPLSREIVEIETGSHVLSCEAAGIDCLLDITASVKSTGAEVSREQIVISKTGLEHARSEDVCYEDIDDGYPLIRIHEGKPEIIMPSSVILEGDTAFSGPDVESDVIRVTASDPYTVLFRAPTDNDYRFGGAVNTMQPFIAEKEKILTVDETDDKITVKSRISCKGSSFICTDIYQKADSKILITSTLHCVFGRGNLPRFGKTFRVAQSFDHVDYYGRDGESYADMKDHTQIRTVSCGTADMTEPNIRPQESGNRSDTRWASVSDGKHRITFRAEDRDFDLGIKPYSDRELLTMKHREDEKASGTYVTISAFQQGLGTGICGPAPSPEVCFPMKRDYTLKFSISID
ncbi:MAG: hypothetical protein IJH41_05155 [Eubacterium sp.]|nr:hypothetical protein [Eubacterium sp.]